MESYRNASLLCGGLLLLVLVTSDVANGCSITIRNRCSYMVTTCARASGTATNLYNIGAGGSQTLDFGATCNWEGGIVFPSVGGTCSDANLANVAEFTLSGSSDFYDLSNVNAYTIGLAIVPTQIAGGESPNGLRCGSPKCVINDIRGFCTSNNYIVEQSTGALSCINRDGTAGVQSSTAGTQVFENACPSSYSYPFDDANSLFTCSRGTNYDVIFCP